MITLQNDALRVTIASKGAELQNIFSKETEIEYLWNGDAAFWPRRSPVLFPIVGSVKNDTYIYKEKEYSLPRHGFARDMEFAEEKISETEAVYTLTDTVATLPVYPFPFMLRLLYSLKGKVVYCTYEVTNPGREELLFSIGAHPAFAVPLDQATQYDDYYLQWSTPEPLERWIQEGGLSNMTTEAVKTDNGRLSLKHSLFYDDAIVLKNLKSNTISIGSTKHTHGIHFSFDNFPFFGIWASKDAPFVCLEPWCGITDNTTHNQQLVDKEGIIKLAPGGAWERGWGVECF